jgi:hypothetical protein
MNSSKLVNSKPLMKELWGNNYYGTKGALDEKTEFKSLVYILFWFLASMFPSASSERTTIPDGR